MSSPETYQENAFAAERTRIKRLKRAEVILDERDRQDVKWGVLQNHSLPEWMTILVEEVGELATAIQEKCFGLNPFPNKVLLGNWRKEAIQVAAVALAMVEQTPEEK